MRESAMIRSFDGRAGRARFGVVAAAGAVALLFALLLPRGIWGEVERRLGVQLLPVGYRLDPGTAQGRPAGTSKDLDSF